MQISPVDLTGYLEGYICIFVFVFALSMVMMEEFTYLRKSKPVLASAGLIWFLIAILAAKTGTSQAAEEAVRANLLQYAELMLFMLVAMTYVNALDERLVFSSLRSWVKNRGFSYRQMFWFTGLGVFFLSPILDNLATALLAGAITLSLGVDDRRFVGINFVNIVVAANAGGVFSPFGDVTTLMVWVNSTVTTLGFWSFFALFLPSLVSYLIPAAIMYLAVPSGSLHTGGRSDSMRRGGKRIMLLFLAAIATTVIFRSMLHLPAVIGMLTGLSYLQLFGFYLKITHRPTESDVSDEEQLGDMVPLETSGRFDIFSRIARAEWDALLFLYGIALSVGGLAYLGYLNLASDMLYSQWGATTANISFGLFSSILENIPMLYAVLSMAPDMSAGQWLLVTLAIGTGGSILSISSAAGVALMCQARGRYTFFVHLRWTPVILIGFFAGVITHIWINQVV